MQADLGILSMQRVGKVGVGFIHNDNGDTTINKSSYRNGTLPAGLLYRAFHGTY